MQKTGAHWGFTGTCVEATFWHLPNGSALHALKGQLAEGTVQRGPILNTATVQRTSESLGATQPRRHHRRCPQGCQSTAGAAPAPSFGRQVFARPHSSRAGGW